MTAMDLMAHVNTAVIPAEMRSISSPRSGHSREVNADTSPTDAV